jgi:predicted glycoside hydrolase/deacetylase ChbG (UPF0249 family)
MPQLIITVDDCGVSEGINTATVDLYNGGYITTASVMSNYPAYKHAFELFQAHPNLEIGAHLVLTNGYPVTDDIPDHSPIISKDNTFRNKFHLFSRSFFPSDETIIWIRHELDAQLRRFADAGIQPQHITTHHHFHTIPALRKIIYELAVQYRVKWVRAHDFRATITPYNLIFSEQRLVGDLPFEIPTYLSPLKSWMGRSPSEYATKLMEFDGVVEILTHPSIEVDDTFPANIDYGSLERYQEQVYLIKTIDYLRQLQLQTVGTA